jgi:peptidoglycan hydrolase-like protein with peptidoglycan-binding domain
MISLALSLINQKDTLTSVLTEAVTLSKQIQALLPKIEALLPELTKKVEAVTKGGTTANLYTVKWLQESLNKLVDAKLVADGSYGKATHDAVKKFQTAKGLVSDGWAGILTTAAIIKALK